MTPEELAAKAAVVRAHLERWLPFVGIVVLALVLVRQCNGRRAAEAALEAERKRASEAAALEARGLEVAAQLPDLGPELERLKTENADLRSALEAAQKAAPDAKPVAVVSASTGPVAVRVAAPRTDPPKGEPAPGSAPAVANPPTPGDRPGCLLAAGDQGEVRVEEVTLRTRAGNDLLVGTARAYRLDAGQEPTLLFGGPFSAPTTRFVETAPPAKPVGRWGAGPLVAGTREGWAAGALLATPSASMPLLHWGVEALAGGGIGPSGSWVAMGSVLVRP